MNHILRLFVKVLGIRCRYQKAKILLEYFKWNFDRASKEYFLNRRRFSLNLKFNLSKNERVLDVECHVCLLSFQINKLLVLSCGHLICKDCLTLYVLQVHKKQTFHLTNCPYFKCKMIMTRADLEEIGTCRKTILLLHQKQDSSRFNNFVQFNYDLKACAGKNCKNVQRFFKIYNLGDVHCHCGYDYCSRCNSQRHHPCSCEVAKKWIDKESSEKENLKWIVAKTKRCPGCRIPIEKNQGCNHIICWNCKSEFCWLCKSNWKNHDYSMGGFYRCNIYETKKKKKRFKQNKNQEEARSELKRYSFYFERYRNHIKSILIIDQLFEVKKDSLNKKLLNTLKECRHLLAWTYPIAYYMEENYSLKKLFQQYQRDLEKYTEHLYELMEKLSFSNYNNFQQNEILDYWKMIEKYRISFIRIIKKEINIICDYSRR